ncbi:MAG: hypothetical protein ACLP0J_30820 [Solirubrobacteraceae bacterium]
MRYPSAGKGRASWRLGRRVLVVAVIATIAVAGSAYGAFVGLPLGGAQINNDPPTIDPTQNVNVSDLTAGSLTGTARIPWAAFAQAQNGSPAVNIVVRAFKNGAWQTEGFPESLNHDSTQAAASPSIDFTGANRTVPWVAWDEPVTALGTANIFASRFASQLAPAQNGGQWIPEGQRRTSSVPSLNINTNREALDPSLIGGTTNAGANPVPWVTWEEADNGSAASSGGPPGNPANPNAAHAATFQIFVSHAVAATNSVCPVGTQPTGGNSVGNFCFQEVGIPRVSLTGSGTATDPSLNVDPTRDGIQADIAFTGTNDSVPWAVWYENSDNGTTTDGLLNADMVFAARGIADVSGNAIGGFHWQVVGLGTAGKTATDDVLDTGQSGHGAFGECAQSQANEQVCSLDAAPLSVTQQLTDGNGAENPSVTAGTMVPGKATTPWVAWDESSSNGGLHSVFVARLDSAGDHFDLLNNGQPISHSGVDSTRPDIVFAGNTPYVSWHETNLGTGQTVTFVGHFEGNAANPVFHIDTLAIPNTPQGTTGDNDTTDVRTPVASTCPDDPFTSDGSACPAGSIGTPFFAYTDNAAGPQELFAQGYTPGTTTTGAPSAVTETTASLAGTVDTDGAPTLVHFDYGTSTAYGASTTGQLLAPAAGVSTPVAAALTALPAGTLIHYRVVAETDFGTVDGQDATFTTARVPVVVVVVGKPTASNKALSGVGNGRPKLSLTLNAGANAPALVKVSVHLPSGLSFASKAKSLAKGVTAKGRGATRIKSLTVSHGTLTITLRSPTTSVTITIKSPAITVSHGLARKVKHKQIKTLDVTVKVTDTNHLTTQLVLKIKTS